MLSPNISSRSRISRIIIYAIVTSTILLMAAERSNSAVFPFLDSVRELIGSTSQCVSAPLFGAGDSTSTRTGTVCAGDTGVDAFADLGAASAPFVTYQLDVTKSGSGGGTVTTDVGAINCGATCTATYEEGQMVAITATPDSTSQFAGWSGACAGTMATCVVTMSQNKSVNATFTRNQYLLTVSKTGTGSGTVTSSPAGISCGTSCSATYVALSSVTLTAAADGTSVFMGWSGGGCSGTGNCVVSLTTAITVTAQFELIVAPTVTTNIATSVTGSSATLNGVADPNGASTTGWFRYSTISPGTCNDSFGTRVPTSGGVALGSGTSPQNYSQSITGLASGSTYYYCAMAFNAQGMGFGSLLSFTTPAPPTVTTSPASSILITTATFNGVANPNGASTTGWFRYGTISPGTCNDSFGTRSPTSGGSALGASTTPQNYSQALTGLTTGTTYYFCAIASNAIGTSFGSVLSFTTLAPPTVTTSAATSVGGTTATVNGSANPNGLSTTGWYRYSSTNPGICNDSFGTRAPASGGSALGAGTSPQNYAQALSGLVTGTTYYFCAISSNAAGTSFGSVLSFTTLAPPTVTTLSATPVTSSGATLNGMAIPNGDSAFGYFRYSLTDPVTCSDTFGTRLPISSASDISLGSGRAFVPYSNLVSGLTPATTYYYCAIARNSLGTRFGVILTFTTSANAPVVTTNGATSITGTTATLNGSANPGGAATTGWFRYSTVSPGTCNDTFGTRAPAAGGSALGSGTTPVAYSQAITGLSSGTIYYFCAIGQNSVSTSLGSILSLTTPMPPTVTTTAATGVTNTTAVLNASANPNGATSTGWFRYSTADPGTCNDSFGIRAPASGATALGAGTSPAAYTRGISGLSPGVTYYYCAIASNVEGTSFGNILSLTTASAPTASTSPATATTSSSVILNGDANPNGSSTTGWFRYSTSDPGTCNDIFGTRAPASSAADSLLGAGTSIVPYSRSVSGLNPATTYYYCAIANNTYGAAFGAVIQFTTNPNVPVVTTIDATAMTATTATLNGSANPGGGATTAWFRYGTISPGTCNDTFGTRAPASGGSTLGAGTSPVSYSQVITGLTSETLYYYCAIATNSEGISFGSVLSFTTAAPTCQPAPAGMVSMWAAENNPLDRLERNNAALMNGANYAPGLVGQAFSFDGIDDYIEVPDSASLSLTGGLTLGAWVKQRSAGYGTIFSKADHNGSESISSYGLQIGPDGSINVALYGTYPADNWTTAAGLVTVGQWNHIALTWDGTYGPADNVKLYINGSFAQSWTKSGTPLNVTTQTLTLGSMKPPTYYGHLDGLIDEPAIFDRALSSTEINAIYNARSAGFCNTCTSAPVGLVSWWTGDGNGLDSRSVNNGTLQNGAVFAAGKVGQAFSFNGADQHVEIPDDASLQPTNGITLAGWFMFNTSTPQAAMISKPYLSGASNAYALWVQGGVLYGSTAGAYLGNAFSPVPGQWYYIAYTYDDATSQHHIYVDGNVFASAVSNATPTYDAAPLLIGMDRDNGSPVLRMNGMADEVGIYDRALTISELRSILASANAGICRPTAVTPPTGMVAWWGGDGNAGDNSGTGNQGNLIDSAGFAVGKVGQAFKLDGVNDYVEVPHSASINFGATQPMSFDVWLKRTSTNTYQPIFTKRPDCVVELHYYFAYYAGDNSLLFGSTGAPANGVSTTADKLPLDVWTHVSVSFDGTNATMYVNGDPVATHAMTFNPNTAPLAIGGQPTCGSYFGGTIDELTFYNRAITPAEIMGIYNAGLAGKLKSEITPANALAGQREMVPDRSLDIPGIQLGDATVTLPIVSTGGVTQQIPLDPAKLPPLPMGATPTGLTYDIATSAIWSGTPSICFNLPALSSVYRNLRILHLENGVWVNRTQVPGVNPTLCTFGLTSLSPFTIADFGPTAATVSVSGRVLTVNGNGVLNAIVQLTDHRGSKRTARTSSLGYYRFDDVMAGETYVIGVASKRFVFTPRTVTVSEELTDVDLVAEAP